VNENINIHLSMTCRFLMPNCNQSDTNVKSNGRNSFSPLSKVWISLHLFSPNTHNHSTTCCRHLL